ncbi:hypothetical protein FR943_24210 [Mycobacterium sp. TNTM28]|uniref:DUF202 domain-containing protein n=1 Tax=[Mycobacterium] fortunisiensis TaxID=2600579 RepID=A0ABS6KTF4_9MYCO|nr:hypothetical protein [[Mycobacterium] fortunisiensis]
MSIFTDLRRLDSSTWTLATRSSPFVIQSVFAILLFALWALGKWPFGTGSGFGSERAWMLTATVVAAGASLGIAGVLSRSQSAQRQAYALSFTGCSAVVLLGGAIYAFLILR